MKDITSFASCVGRSRTSQCNLDLRIGILGELGRQRRHDPRTTLHRGWCGHDTNVGFNCACSPPPLWCRRFCATILGSLGSWSRLPAREPDDFEPGGTRFNKDRTVVQRPRHGHSGRARAGHVPVTEWTSLAGTPFAAAPSTRQSIQRMRGQSGCQFLGPRMDLSSLNVTDSRRLEVVADGLPLFRDVQLAVKEATYPELVAPRARARLVVWLAR